ncbi:galactitol-1-phosphate 5-dehydrogenase [Cerasicoccus maritimus]|uniref:galactitol-1-phosphate 5-dehydrogenase n=1 Tax=Cerasicoccus maritimus TaxID=490089 RepID=UPI002852D285|nr:galactitol-1-phosphate 5-dehydrogenase [Cerasicoccus maritimus]
MKALVLEANQQLTYTEQHPLPEAPDERPTALVKIAACGICGSDIPRGFGGKAYFYPLVMGHEFSGVVEEPAPNGRFKQGDRVAVFPLIPKNMDTDPANQTGNYAQSREYDYYGSRRDGAFSEYLRIPEWNLFPVPDHVDLLHASMTEPAAVALHAIRKMNIQAGSDAVVFGAGPIGNMAAQWLRIHGCSQVFIVDVEERKLRLAEEMGFAPINAKEVDPVPAILEMTDQQGVHCSVEACGLPITFLQALQVAGMFGEVVFMGNIVGEFKIGEKDFSNILRKELTIHGTWNSKITPVGVDDWTTVLKHLDRELIVAPLITDKLPLSAGPEIFDDLANRRNYHNKVIFDVLNS